MRKHLIILISLFSGLIIGFGAAAAGANESSDKVCFYSDFAGHGYRQQADTINAATPARGGHHTTYSVGSTCPTTGSVSQPIGGAAYLKKTSGAVCVTASVSYVTGTVLTKSAYYNASACGGAGTSLQGTGTGYGYTGSGYASGTIAAPFQTF